MNAADVSNLTQLVEKASDAVMIRREALQLAVDAASSARLAETDQRNRLENAEKALDAVVSAIKEPTEYNKGEAERRLAIAGIE